MGEPKEQERAGGGEAAKAGDAPRPVAIPRPPSREALDRLSEAQGMITDEWTGDAAGTGAPNPEDGRPEDVPKVG